MAVPASIGLSPTARTSNLRRKKKGCRTEMTQDFTFEFHTDLETLEDELQTEAEERLRKLGQGHSDLIGAAVAVRGIVHAETPHRFEARVVVYARPNQIAAVEKAESPKMALKGALTAVERQVREKREKMSGH
jgi:ribosome-associated translation inhibitor RaiA